MCSHKTEVIDGADLQPLDGKHWRQGVKHLLLFLLLSFMAQAQDTSIRPFFLDSNFRYCDSAKARYYGYSLYDCSGKAKSTPTAYMGKNYSIRYYTNSKESESYSCKSPLIVPTTIKLLQIASDEVYWSSVFSLYIDIFLIYSIFNDLSFLKEESITLTDAYLCYFLVLSSDDEFNYFSNRP